MIKPFLISLLMALPLFSFAESKKTVKVETAGTLSSLIAEDEKFTITDLTLSGRLNGDDLRFLREMAGNDISGNPTQGRVTKLDLSDAKIVAGGGYYIKTNFIRTSNGDGAGGWRMYCTTENEKLGDWLFAACDKLEEVKLPNSIKAIGDGVFYHASSLKSLTIPKYVTSIGKEVLWACNILKTLDVDAKNTTFKSPTGSNAIIKDKTLVLGCLYTIIPDNTINAIDPYAFSTGFIFSFQLDVHLKIPEGVTTIDINAFRGCGFKSIDIPESVTYIGDWAFADSGKLTKMIFRITDLSKVKMGGGVFREVPSEAILYVPKGMVDKYKTTAPWNHFADVREIGSDSETSIHTIDASASDDSVYYNLQGQRVEHPTKGLYIKNGKIVLIK